MKDKVPGQHGAANVQVAKKKETMHRAPDCRDPVLIIYLLLVVVEVVMMILPEFYTGKKVV